MHKVSDLLGPMKALAHIRPPGRSYADWDRFLEECREAGVSALLDGKTFAGPLGYALLKRWRWLKDARERGIPFDVASEAFNAACERESEADRENDRQRSLAAARALQERNNAGKRKETRRKHEDDDEIPDALFGYANERIKA